MEAGPASEGALQELPGRRLPEAGHRARPLCGALRAGLSGQAGGRDWRDADARPRDVATRAAGNTTPEMPFSGAARSAQIDFVFAVWRYCVPPHRPTDKR